MPLEPSAFTAELRGLIDAGRSFGRHPLWLEIAEGKLSLPQLRAFAAQFFLQVREFPRAVSAMHARCPFPEVRRELAESLYEEETGRISGCDLAHPKLFLRFGRGLGMRPEELLDAHPLPTTRSLIEWFELSTQQRSFIEAAAAINLAAEGQVPGAFGPFARALERHYGLPRESVAFWDIHELADAEHSGVGDHIVVKFAASDELQARVRGALARSLEVWWQFFDGIARALQG
jgi:pyrroloquinoline-quinone synthase